MEIGSLFISLAILVSKHLSFVKLRIHFFFPVIWFRNLISVSLVGGLFSYEMCLLEECRQPALPRLAPARPVPSLSDLPCNALYSRRVILNE